VDSDRDRKRADRAEHCAFCLQQKSRLVWHRLFSVWGGSHPDWLDVAFTEEVSPFKAIATVEMNKTHPANFVGFKKHMNSTHIAQILTWSSHDRLR
jgi:hypothetical protein